MLRTDELDYNLPRELIATQPVQPRDSARLLVVSRTDPSRLEHRIVRDLPEFLVPDDLLTFNTTAVVPARLQGVREDTGGKVQGLYLRDARAESGELQWEVLLKARRFKPGMKVRLVDAGAGPEGAKTDVCLTVLERTGEDEPGVWRVAVECGEPGSTQEVLSRVGATPLPPYILQARKALGLDVPDEEDRERYQTVFADAAGSVAAPTAGLHFTPELLDKLAAKGVKNGQVVLHVGTGTFKPVEAETVEEHQMHSEWCSMSQEVGRQIEQCRAVGGTGSGRVFAVGTTAARTIESYAAAVAEGGPWPESLDTRLLVTPGYEWRWTQGLLTNFHLPRSTLMAMVGAMFPEGVGQLKEVYAQAIDERYRFYSYGDAMLILP